MCLQTSILKTRFKTLKKKKSLQIWGMCTYKSLAKVTTNSLELETFVKANTVCLEHCHLCKKRRKYLDKQMYVLYKLLLEVFCFVFKYLNLSSIGNIFPLFRIPKVQRSIWWKAFLLPIHLHPPGASVLPGLIIKNKTEKSRSAARSTRVCRATLWWVTVRRLSGAVRLLDVHPCTCRSHWHLLSLDYRRSRTGAQGGGMESQS